MLRFVTVDAQGQRKLESGILTDVRITADARANALVVSAPAESMELIEALDPPARQAAGRRGADQGLHDRQRRRHDAGRDAASVASASANDRAGGSAVGGQLRPNRRGQRRESLVPLRFAVDVRTNSIIASGDAGRPGGRRGDPAAARRQRRAAPQERRSTA